MGMESGVTVKIIGTKKTGEWDTVFVIKKQKKSIEWGGQINRSL